MQQIGTFQDRFGLPLSTGSAAAAERYVDGIDRVLSAAVDAELSLMDAISADEGFAMAHAALAPRLQLQGKTDAAKASAARARELTGGLTRRERQHVEVIATAVNGDSPRALALAREHLAEFPRDGAILQQASSLIAGSGARDRREQRLALHERLAPQYGDDWWFLGSHGFACHELDLFEQSRTLSERSLELCPQNSNASHNLAHVFYETSDHTGGVDFLGGWLAGYAWRAPFHCHLSWHLALFELTLGHYRRAMEIYERDITPALVESRTTLEDAASLLWRCELYGCAEAPLPWGAVRDLAARATARAGVAFADVHAAFAYAAVCDEAALGRLIDALRELEARGNGLAGGVVLPLVQGIGAFGQGEYEAAIRLLEPIAGQFVRVGGSHAQREVFEDTLLEACLRAGRFEQAESLLRERLNRRPSARDYFWRGRAEAGSGATEAATSSLREALQRWRGADLDSPEIAALNQLAAVRT